jgi:hypothetical protein
MGLQHHVPAAGSNKLIALEDPIVRILKDFCHVEWYEVDELAALVKSGSAKFDVNTLRQQFESLLSQPNGIAPPINKLTANEFESDEEARFWLEDVYRKVFN